MVRNLSLEMYPVVAYAHNLSSFLSPSQYKNIFRQPAVLERMALFPHYKKWLKFFTSQGEEGFYWVKLEVHEAPWSQLSRNTCSGTVMQGNSCQAQSCFSGLVTLTTADTGMAPLEPLVWQEGTTQKPWGNDLVSWVTHRHLAADIQSSLWAKLKKIWSENGKP